MDSKREIVYNNIDKIKEWELQHIPLMEVARRLEMKYDTLVKHFKSLGVSYIGNKGRKGIPHLEGRTDIISVLNSNRNNASKRRRLIEDGLKEEKCECCGLSEWMGKPIPLELHHKDFNHFNNSLNNLQILCANCHMQAHNYCNVKRRLSSTTG